MSTRSDAKQSVLKRRIRQFYEMLNDHEFRRCHKMIDPRVLAKPSSVTLFQYENALSQFMGRFGSITILEISITLHINEPSKLYDQRDFAVGETTWADEAGERHVLSERWVKEGRAWYTRATGFATPAIPEKAIPLARAEGSSAFRRPDKQSRNVKSQ